MTNIDQRFLRYREAYITMNALARFRPAAPSDGCGNIQLDEQEQRDRERLAREADQYAVGFVKQDDGMEYPIGCPDFMFNRAFC